MNGALTAPERNDLDRLEAVIERGVKTFIEVGNALAEIRDLRLYRETHKSFEGYCAERWGFSKRRANQLVQAAHLGTMVPVANERQARELMPLTGDEAGILEVWDHAQAAADELGVKLTAKVVKNAVNKQLGRVEREVRFGALRTRVYTCVGCGAKSSPGVPFITDGRGRPACDDCRKKYAREDELERKAWWDSLSEKKQREHLKAGAIFDAKLKLEGSLRAITGECSIAEFLRGYAEEVRSIEVRREHRDLLACLLREVTEITDVAHDLGEWLAGVGHAVLDDPVDPDVRGDQRDLWPALPGGTA